jgi:hypothetical protein
MTEHGVGLAAAIESLRQELLDAVDAGRDQPMRFQLSPIELTLQVALTKEANGKVGWRILELGGSLESVATQTIKLTLEPGWLVNGQYLNKSQFTISSEVSPGVKVGGQQ